MTLPVIPVWIKSAIKLRSIAYFTTANPCIEDGGFIDESKIELNELIPQAYQPKSLYFKNDFSENSVLQVFFSSDLDYPIIGKPDKGGRGKKVAVINNETDLINYTNSVKEDFLLQEMITYSLEASVFYYRIPDTEEYDIISLVAKEYLSVIGDGKSSVEQLLALFDRGAKQIARLRETKMELMNYVPSENKELIVEPIGNHIRGTIFRNHQDKITPSFKKSFHKIMEQIPGFYFGRIDLKTKSWGDLALGQEIRILEINGVGSDLAHIYDPEISYSLAIADQWRCAQILERVTKASIAAGNKPTSFREIWKKIKRVLEDLNT
jgi:hypothetical protein